MRGNYQLRVEGVLLEVAVAWEFVLYNSMFSMDAVPGTRSYEIKVASTPQSRRIFGHVNDPKVVNTPRSWSACIESGGVLMDVGVLVSARTDSSSSTLGVTGDYVFSFSSNYGRLFGEYAGKLITEVFMGSFDLTGAEDDYLETYYNTGFILGRVKNDGYYGGETVAGFNGYMNDVDTGTFTGPVAVPMVYVKKVLSEFAFLAGVELKGEFYDSAFFEAAVFYANINRKDTEFYLESQLPELVIEQVFMELRKAYNLWVRIDADRKSIRMDYVRDWMSQSPTRDWSGKFARISGAAVPSAGIQLNFSTDSGDELVAESDFYNSYVSVWNTEEGERNTEGRGFSQISTVFSGVMADDDGVAMVRQQGVTADGKGKVATPRILYAGSSATLGLASEFNGIRFNAGDHAASFYAEWEAFLQQGFKYEGPADLKAADIEAMAGCFTGRNSEVPVVHAQGVNWLIEKIVVPSVGLPVVTMWRV